MTSSYWPVRRPPGSLAATCAGAVLTMAMTALVSTAAAQSAAGCAAAAACVDVPTFAASVTDLRTSEVGGYRVVAVNMRVRNRVGRPLLLGYVSQSGLITDDQGNRYAVSDGTGVRGMGVITSAGFDPKFVLQAGEEADVRLEFGWRPSSRGQIVGTSYQMDLALREIQPLAGEQFRLGREHALHFGALQPAGAVAAAVPSAPPDAPASATAGTSTVTLAATGASSAAPAAPAAPTVDPCAGRSRCYATGPFMAEVTQLTGSRVSRHHVLRMNVRIRNLSAQPLILGYRGASGSAVDDLGNRYFYGRAGTHDQSASGIGVVTNQQADPQFVLAPGDSRDATFQLIRYDVGQKPIGTSFTYDLALEQLELLPSRQVRSVRQYAVGFHDLTEGASRASGPAAANGQAQAGDAVQAARTLYDALRGKKKQPPSP